MSKKFNRTYKLTIESNPTASAYYDASLLDKNSNVRLNPVDNKVVNNSSTPQTGRTALVIEPPFTIEVEIDRIVGSSENTAIIKVYGLNEKSRAQLFKDIFNTPVLVDNTPYRKVILEGGYGKEIYPIFIGTLIQGYSFREGVDQITYLHCVSGAAGLYNTFINQSYSYDVTQSQVLNDIIQKLTKAGDIEKGAITPLDERYSGGVLAQGMTFNIASQFGVDIFVDLGKINALKLNEVLGEVSPKKVPVISADTGLLGTPSRSGNYVIINTMFEPQIKLASVIALESITASYFNGFYKVMGISHRGIFSQSKEGKLITTLKLFLGTNIINGFKSIG